jgi:hypothetical protein
MKFSEPLRAFGAALAIIAMVGLTGCGEEGAGEKAGKKLDKAGKEIGKSLDGMKKKLDGK